MTTTNDTTIEQLLAMHDAHYTTMKHELLKLQQAKDDTPAPAPPTPPPAEPAPEPAPKPEHPPFQLVGTLQEMAHDVMHRAIEEQIHGYPVLLKNSKSSTEEKHTAMQYQVTFFNKVVGDHAYTDAPAFWKHVLAYFQSRDYAKIGTLAKELGGLKGVTGRLGIPDDGAYEDYYEDVAMKHTKQADYKELSLEECKAKFQCGDGAVLTTRKLQSLLQDDDWCALHCAKAVMFLSFFAFHGCRPEDWQVGYGVENKNDKGYYQHGEMHLFTGKSQEMGTERVFRVHDVVRAKIDAYCSGLKSPSKFLVQNDKGECGNSKTIRDKLQRSFFKNEKCKELCVKPVQDGTKQKFVGPNDLRHLFESHIRYVLKLPKAERHTIMQHISHSKAVSAKRYAQTYRPMVEWAESQ